MQCGKVIYPTRGEAQVSVKSINERGNRSKGHIYFCNDCAGWHVTRGGRSFKGKNGHKLRKNTKKFDHQEVKTIKPKKTIDKPLYIKNYLHAMNEYKTHKMPLHVPDKQVRLKVTRVMTETLKAWYINCEGHYVWVPKAQAQIGTAPGDPFYTIDLPEWMAKEKLLI